MDACVYCGTPLSEKYNFCLTCNRQVRCIQCRETLVPNKPMCFVCGKPVVVHQDNLEPVNEFTLEEKQTKTTYYKKVQGKLTNVAFGDAASVFSGGASLNRPIISVNPRSQSTQLALPISTVATNISGETQDVQDIMPETPSEVAITHEEKTPKDRGALFFETDGDGTLVPIVSDFKGDNKGEQQRRFMLLFVHAYNYHFRRAIPSEKPIFASMRNRNMFDSNCYNYFNSIMTQYLVKTDAGYKINLDGGNRIEELVHEIEDRTKVGFRDWDKPGKPRNRGSKEHEQEINAWVDMPLELNGFDIRALRKPTHYALFGIWLLTKRLEVTKAVKPTVVYEFLKRKYVAISVNSRTIAGALNRPYNAGFFQKTSEGQFYLTPEGEKRVLEWLQGAPVQDFVGDEQENGED